MKTDRASLPDDTLLLLQQIGQAVRRARMARGDTQQVAAQRIGAHAELVSRIERGEPGVAAGSLLALLDIYGQGRTLWQLAEDTPETQRLAVQKLTRPRGRPAG